MAAVDSRGPRWWLDTLYPRLVERRDAMRTFENYYDGNHQLPFLTKAHADKVRDEFRRLLEESRSNFMQLVVDVVEERLQVDGFRLSARGDSSDDEASWRIWQANQLDAQSPQAFVDALVKGVSYLSVWAGDRPDDFPRIAIEDPLETIVAYTPGSGYRQRDAALKTWRDEYTGNQRANLYLPEGIYKFEAHGEVKVNASPDAPQNTFERVYQAARTYVDRTTNRDATWQEIPDSFVSNPLPGVVPIVPLRNRPRVLCEGRSELDGPHMIQEQINGLTFLAMIAGYFGAHRQRWVTGFQLMQDEDGNPLAPFDSAADRLWVSENKDSKFGDFEQTDLEGYIKLIEQKVLHLAVMTRTPRHYLIQQGQSPSGDAIESAESGLVKKVGRKMAWFGEGLEEAMNLARRYGGAQDVAVDSEVIWADAEVESEAAKTDAAIKRFQANLTPWEQTMVDLGYTATEIARMRTQRAEDALAIALQNPAPPVLDEDVEPVV